MAKASATTGGTGELIHTRTTAGSEESAVAVLGVDGSDNVVGAPAPADTKANPTNALDVGAHGLLWNGSTWDRAPGSAAAGAKVQSAQLPAALVSGRLDVQVGALGAGLVLPIVGSTLAPATGSWTSATALNTAVTVSGAAPYGAANIAINVPTTITGGTVVVEVSHDGTTFYPAGSVRIDNSYPENTIALAFAPGINGNRQWLVSLDAFSHVRVRLLTAITGTGTVTIAVTVGQQGVEPFVAQRSRKVTTYSAIFRVAASPHQFSQALVAGTRKQFATIHHAATATKTVRLRQCIFYVTGHNVAALTHIDLEKITTAPATGNPAITPTSLSGSDGAAEATCLLLPTTQATAGAAIRTKPLNYSAAGTGATVAGDAAVKPIDLLFPSGIPDHEAKLPEIRAGVLEGWAVTLVSSAGPTVSGIIEMEFTEEGP